MASGFPLEPLTILGFVPNKSAVRSAWLERVAGIPHTVVFLEAPHRIAATLREASGILGERQIVVARELTKAHQEFLRGTAAELLASLGTPRGEFTLVIGPIAPSTEPPQHVSDSEIVALFGETTNHELSGRREAIAFVAQKLGIPKKQVYAAVERSKK
jgi:16S rRNA (cytidine1402-2'-O)-methyltransferase